MIQYMGLEREQLQRHERWMHMAIEEALKAKANNEVPIGAIVVHNNEIIGRGYNLRETTLDSTAHAEITAIRQANKRLQAWRLLNCTLYVTLEPCPMCAGAVIQSRVPTVVFGTTDPKSGCMGTLMNLLEDPRFNHQANIIEGVLREECAALLTQFFRQLRGKA